MRDDPPKVLHFWLFGKRYEWHEPPKNLVPPPKPSDAAREAREHRARFGMKD